MKGSQVVRQVLKTGALVGAWCALWGAVSGANIAAGLLITGGLELLKIGPSRGGGIRLLPMARLLWMVLVDLATSTIVVAREILRKQDQTQESIIAVPVTAEGRQHMLLLIIAITVTPGTAVVDSDFSTGVLHLHLLDHDRRSQVESHVAALAELACRALPTHAANVKEVLK